MPRPAPHPSSIFSLVPISARAQEALDHPNNRHLVSITNDRSQTLGQVVGIDVGFDTTSSSPLTLATIGRNADITVEGANISRVHCAFEAHEETGEIMFRDFSGDHSTRLFGPDATPFIFGSSRRCVVIDETINLEIGFGGASGDLFRWRILWHRRLEDLQTEMASKVLRMDNPRDARTVWDDTDLPSQPATRIHSQEAHIRYSKRKRIGPGAFGKVICPVDGNTGLCVAIKQIRKSPLNSREYLQLKREVRTLSRLSQSNIIKFIGAQYSKDSLDVNMDLKSGTERI